MFDDVNTQSAPPVQPTPAPQTTPNVAPPAPTAPTATSGSEEIHTMPMDYYTGGKTANIPKGPQPAVMQSAAPTAPAYQTSGAPAGKKKIMNIAIIVVLVLVVGISAYLLYASYQAPANNQNVNVEDQVAVVEEQPVVEEPATEEAAQPDENTPPPVDIPTEQPAVEEKINFDPSKLSDVSLSLMASLDKDKDGLTDAEEALIGTDPNMNDTDKDTYRDGDEMKNFYSPIKAGSTRINEEGFAKAYENTSYGYKLLYPSTWLASPLKENDPKEVMFTSKGNEFVNIFVDTKPAEQTLDAWYLERAPSISATQLKKYQNYKKNAVIESPDGFTAYVANGTRVYIINYNIGLNEEANYPGLFAMMVNSFEFGVIEPVATAPAVNFAGIMESLGVPVLVDNKKVVTEFPCGNTACFYDSFETCEPVIGIFKLADNLTYEISVGGREGGNCVYSARFTKHPEAAWAGKIMKCTYNPEQNFETAISRTDTCTGELAQLIRP